MSILTDLLNKKITFSQAAAEADGWATKIVASDPAMTSAVAAATSDLKQAAGNAIALADSDLAPYVTTAATATSAALEAALAAVTKGLSLPFNPLITSGIDTIANAVKAEADAWAAKTKASLVPPAA